MSSSVDSMGRAPWRWIVAQAGAREHYAVPRAAQMTSTLEALYTGSWSRTGRSLLRKGPAILRAFAGHHHPDLAEARVISFNPGFAAWHLHRALIARPSNVEQVYRWEVANSRWFARHVLRRMNIQALKPDSHCFFGFQSECLEILHALADRQFTTILDMAGPGQVEDQLVQAEAERWPGWARIDPQVPAFYYERVAGESQKASLVLVNSEWSRRAWVQQGVPDEKIITVPLAYEPTGEAPPPRQEHHQQFTALWLGSVILRKGIQYLIEAARLLRDHPIQIIVAGPLGISEQAVAAAPPNVTFAGRVSRIQAGDLYRQADVFVLPTVSDGFAITQLEAMAHGVPVIATPNCGDVVTHGRDGLIVPVCDAAGLASAIAQLESDRALVAEMSKQALLKSRQFSVRAYGERMNAAVTQLRQRAARTMAASA